MRYTIILLATSLLIQLAGNAQHFNRDSSRTINLSAFNELVDKSIHLLESKNISQIPDSDQVSIMMCLNTISVCQNGPLQQKFASPNNQKLLHITKAKAYTREIIKVYPNWTPNRGMGFYFLKLKMELYGTPSLYAIFNVQ